jgi:hypothetical protein
MGNRASARDGGQAAIGDIINNTLIGHLAGNCGTVVIQHLHVTAQCDHRAPSGLIDYFDLEDWWLYLSDRDRGIIEDAIGPEVCREKIHATSQSASSWLRGIAWRICAVHAQLASRLRAKATGIDTGTEIDDYWSRQLDVVRRHWQRQDFADAREALRKVGYRMREENALPDALDAFAALQADLFRADPYYTEVIAAVLPIIRSRPGVIQSVLAKGLTFDVDRFRHAMYYGELLGDLRRVKHGRSYGLFTK